MSALCEPPGFWAPQERLCSTMPTCIPDSEDRGLAVDFPCFSLLVVGLAGSSCLARLVEWTFREAWLKSSSNSFSQNLLGNSAALPQVAS